MGYTRRLFLACLTMLLSAASVSAEDGLTYLNDQAIKQSIERHGTTMLNDESATPNDTFQEQLQRTHAQVTLPDSQALLDNSDAIYDHASDGVIIVAGLYLCGRCDNYHAKCASGFLINEEGVAVTNHHVIKSDNNLTLVAMTRDGQVFPVTEVLASNARDDVALIRLGGDGPFKPLPIARDAQVGQRVHTITHPDGRFYTYTSGEISRLFMEPHRDGPPVKRIQITAEYAKGSSGGPILNDQGQVVALVTTTESVYYTEQDGKQENLQMVFYNCVSFESILDLMQKAPE